MTVNAIYFSVVADVCGVRRDHGHDVRRSTGHALGRALLSSMLVEIWGVAREEVRISAEPSGKPVLETAGKRVLPFISISHTRGWVACAASEIGPLGIDIEWHRPGRNHVGIAVAAFGPREQQRALKDASAFYRIWTLREAIAKATGEGLKLAADRCDRVHEGPDEGTWRVQLDKTCWSLTHHRVQSNLNLATAVMLTDASQSLVMKRWDPATSVQHSE